MKLNNEDFDADDDNNHNVKKKCRKDTRISRFRPNQIDNRTNRNHHKDGDIRDDDHRTNRNQHDYRTNRNQHDYRTNRNHHNENEIRQTFFKQVKQEWDINNPCESCSYVFLKSIPKASRHICCFKGRAAYYNDQEIIFPKLKQLPIVIKRFATNYTSHMSKKSAFYNNMLSIVKIGIDNGRGNRYERLNAGPSNVAFCYDMLAKLVN